MPTIGIRVDEETKRKWDILNKHPDRIGTKELKKALREIIEKYSDWIESYEKLVKLYPETFGLEKTDNFMVETISEREILSEI